ncbi:MAG: LptF/LptG family permease [Bacteroidales bacterium]|nr:LptF/LptG family permease [Bacteroidales bacterium]
MKKLHLYMLKSFLGPFVFTFFIALFIILLQFLWKYIDDLVGKGLELYIIGKLMFFASSTFVPLALPLAILLSSLMTFGNMGEHYELVAIKAAGISLRKAMKPLTILAVALSISAFLFSNYVLPVANLKFQALLYDIRQQKLAFNITEGIYYNGMDGIVIRVGKKDSDNKTIYDIQIYDHTDRMGNTIVTTAERGLMELTPDQKGIVFSLFNGYRYTEVTDQPGYRRTRPFESMRFEKQRRTFDLSEYQLSRTNEDLFRSHYRMLNIQQLNYSIDSLSKQRIERLDVYKKRFAQRNPYLVQLDTLDEAPDTNATSTAYDSLEMALMDTLKYPLLDNFTMDAKYLIIDNALKSARSTKENIIFFKNEQETRQQAITNHEIVWHQKFKLSIACLIFFFIGAPLGAIIRKGGLGLPVVVSVLFFVLYYVVSMTGEKAAKAGEWNVVFAIWLSTILILPLGLFLTYKATTDAQLLDAESWKKFFEKFNLKKYLKKT